MMMMMMMMVMHSLVPGIAYYLAILRPNYVRGYCQNGFICCERVSHTLQPYALVF